MTFPIRSFNLEKLLATQNSEVKSLYFSSDFNTRVDYGSSGDFRFGSSWCIETSVYLPKDIDSGNAILLRVTSDRNDLKIYVESGNIVKLSINDDVRLTSTSALVSGEYNHILINSVNAYLNLFINGTNEDTGTISLGAIPPYSGSPTASTYSDGVDFVLKYLRIHAAATLDDAINNAANYDIPVYPPNTAKASWDYKKIVGNVVPDISENANYGLIEDFQEPARYPELTKPCWRSTGNPYVNTTTIHDYITNRDDQISVEGWVYIEEEHASGTINLFELTPTPGNSLIFRFFAINSSNSLGSLIYDRDGLSEFLSQPILKYGEWVHVGLAWSSNDTSYSMSVNGEVYTGSISAQSSLNLTPALFSGITLGDTGAYTTRFRNWRLYNKKLTAGELHSAYKYPTEYPVSRSYVIGDWKFQEESVGWLYDCSDHGNYLYPVQTSGVEDYVWEYLPSGGLYSEIWDGYGHAATNINIYGDFSSAANNANFVVHDNSVIECLYFLAYNDTKRQDWPTNSYPFGVYYGQYIINDENSDPEGFIRYTQYYDNGGSNISPAYYAYDGVHTSTNKIKAMDGKWHHVVGMYSRENTISGTTFHVSIFHNGKLAGVYDGEDLGVSLNNVGNLAVGHYLNGALTMARLYSPTTSGMSNWLDGTNLYLAPVNALENCVNIEDPGIVYDAYFDYDNQNIINKVTAYPHEETLINGTQITKVPLSWKYFKIDGTIPEVPTPKFAITDIEIGTEYALEAEFRINTPTTSGFSLNVITSDYINFYYTSGIYVADITPTVQTSGLLPLNRWNHVLYRYRNDEYSFILNGNEIASGIANDWNSPQETVKWGFYANPPLQESKLEVRRIAEYDEWVPESDILGTVESLSKLADYPLTSDFRNYI